MARTKSASPQLLIPGGIGKSESALIGVSGGRDSIALLDLLVNDGWKNLVVCHLNHQLRGKESDEDERFVRRAARRLGLKFEGASANVLRLAGKRKLSIETAAREARRAFFLKAASKLRSRHLFLAHHADDQAETVLMNLFRGSGLAGVAGMSACSEETLPGLTVLRPLLNTSRAEVDAYVRRRQLEYREDASNLSLDHTRNRVRQELLPLAEKIFQRDVRPLLTRFAEMAHDDDGFLQTLAGKALIPGFMLKDDGSLQIADTLREAVPALASRMIATWLSGKCGYQAQHREIQQALRMLRAGGPAKVNLRGGRFLRRKAGRLWVEQGRMV
jgi:tRNA(Ile)-lysidine synthase